MNNQVNEEQNPFSIEHGKERPSVAFTPGPWKVGATYWYVNGVYHEANARLIAASPDLYAALKAMLYIFDRGLPETSIGRKTCDEARAALELVTPK